MIESSKNQYEPDYVSPPGDTLLETIESIGMSQAELARRTGRPIKTINQIIKGKCSISPDTSIHLERALGISATFWNNRESHYQEFLARNKEYARQKQHIQWLKQFPIKIMIKYGWIPSSTDEVSQLQELLSFFGVVSPESWELIWNKQKFAFRQSSSFETDFYAVTSWLRRGELKAQRIECEPFDNEIFRTTLNYIRNLTTKSPEVFQPELIKSCTKAGVVIVFTRELPKTGISGATQWISPKKAVIHLSIRYKTNDHLWFTFFHEAGHLLLHGKQILVDYENDYNSMDTKADEFAANLLIPNLPYRQFLQRGYFQKSNIASFADTIGVAPGIVVGRLQHDRRIPYKIHNDLKVKFTWAD